MEVVKELHAAVANACEASFDNAYKHMKSHIDAHAKEAEIKELLANQAQRQSETRIRELQRDISVLRSELQQYEIDPRDLELPGKYANLETEFDPKNLWGGDLDDGDHHNLRKSRKRVEAKYTALYTNLQTLIQTWSGLKSRVLQHKKKLRRWDQQLEREEFSLVLNGQPVTFRRVQSPTPEDVDEEHSQAQTSSKKRPREQRPDLPAKAIKLSQKTTRADDVHANMKVEEDNQRIIHGPTSESESTQSGSPRRDMEPSESSDTICLMSNVPQQQNQQSFSPTRPGRNLVHSQRAIIGSEHPAVVKNEILSSSPTRGAMHNGEPPFVSTQDLDEIGDTIRTPMKRKAYRDVNIANAWNSENSTSNAHHSTRITPGQQIPQQSHILQPVDGNTRSAAFSAQNSSAKRFQDLGRRAIPALAEDGDDATNLRISSKVGSGVNPGPSEAKNKGGFAQRRLENLLEQSVPSKSPLRLSSKVSGPDLTMTNDAPQSGQTRADMSSQMVPDIEPDDEPFRARPLHRLGLGHFKINPARNQGLDYAYDAVVRKKDDRKCISGCTRPGCCGDRFRAMARLGGLPGKSGVAQEEEDQAILQEFVGEDTQLLRNTSGKERENLLVEARARALANQYGRHRHTHQRAQSPPGFWRTDMPDTQEGEDDLEAAKRLEREKVEERYREAMRPGGLWTWADE
ncbi:DNA repair protein Sae2/CtIP [Penicillium concentricum]|uniref:DNA repair protein Sae2/CtIP n=1 Tax=Penicillium concentricum TaxID=293559 RepID=A0A9W9VIB2_9EURO|nr:DNA repair protein Sae2/CtIP [Penicillium concentricum]KAJ5383303.1 DNA repair protein Sae2/CtIP [Penicillium concentricum]